MARVTVEDCVTVVPNRFELCLIANRRAQDILSGALTTLSGKEKPSVIALREIAEKLVDVDQIRKNVIESTQYKDPIIIVGHKQPISRSIFNSQGTKVLTASKQ